MMTLRQVRAEDSGETPVWLARAIPLAVKVAIFFFGCLVTIGAIRIVPGGIVIGSAADVKALRDTVTVQHTELMRIDSSHLRQIQEVHAEVAGVKSDVRLLIDNSKANTRKNCAELGRQKAMAYGFKCSDGELRLPP